MGILEDLQGSQTLCISWPKPFGMHGLEKVDDARRAIGMGCFNDLYVAIPCGG